MITILDEKNTKLLNLLLSDNPSQEELDTVLNCCLSAEPDLEIRCLLRNLQTSHPSLRFPEAYRGLFKEARGCCLNSLYRLSSHFMLLAPKLAQSGISPALVKGGAMYCLTPSLLRSMDDIDVLVNASDFKKAVNISRQAGYNCCVDVHSADLHTTDSTEGVMDIHRFIPMTSGKGRLLTRDILERSGKSTFYGAECLLPCSTDLLFIAVTNFSRNLLDNTRDAKIIMTILDIKYLISNGIDWDMFIGNCVRTRSQTEVAFVAGLVNSLAPGLFPETIENLADEKAKKQFLNFFLFRRELLFPLQMKRSELLLKDVFRQPRNIPEFLFYRPLYFLLKLFKYSPRMGGTLLHLTRPV